MDEKKRERKRLAETMINKGGKGRRETEEMSEKG